MTALRRATHNLPTVGQSIHHFPRRAGGKATVSIPIKYARLIDHSKYPGDVLREISRTILNFRGELRR